MGGEGGRGRSLLVRSENYSCELAPNEKNRGPVGCWEVCDSRSVYRRFQTHTHSLSDPLPRVSGHGPIQRR